MIGGVIAVLSNVDPFDPYYLLSNHIIPQVSLYPLVDDFYLSIHLGMVASAWSEVDTT